MHVRLYWMYSLICLSAFYLLISTYLITWMQFNISDVLLSLYPLSIVDMKYYREKKGDCPLHIATAFAIAKRPQSERLACFWCPLKLWICHQVTTLHRPSYLRNSTHMNYICILDFFNCCCCLFLLTLWHILCICYVWWPRRGISLYKKNYTLSRKKE